LHLNLFFRLLSLATNHASTVIKPLPQSLLFVLLELLRLNITHAKLFAFIDSSVRTDPCTTGPWFDINVGDARVIEQR
jgi:hypothetical protein